MKALTAGLIAFWILVSAPAHAQTSPVVVELYTSQGCSSCPPADAILQKLAQRDDVIALALHVDYWDYIGWADTFADPIYTTRQKGYAQAGGRRMIYTPQMIINGQDDVVGAKPMEVVDLIRRHSERTAPVSLQIQRSGDRVVIKAQSIEAAGPMVVQLVRFTPLQAVEITRGENRGKTIDYANITHGWTKLADWNGDAPFEMRAEAPGDDAVVVLVQGSQYGPILAAAQLR